MTGYVRYSEFEIEFDGEKISGKLKPLSFPDLLQMEKADVVDDADAAKVLAGIVPQYVTDFVGPKAADGSPVTLEEMCATAYFLEVTMDIGRKLLKNSRPPQKPSSQSASS